MALELLSGIAGLIALTDLVVVKGSKFYSLTKNALPEIKGLLHGLVRLQGALYSLEKSVQLYNSLRDQEYRTDRRLNSMVYIKDCQDFIIELGKLLDGCCPEEPDVSKWQKFKASLKWPFSVTETREKVQRLESLKSTIAAAVDANSLDALCDILSRQKSVQQSLQRIELEQKRAAKEANKTALDAELRSKLDRLSNYKTKKHAEMRRLQYPGTSEWFRDCDAYKDWLKKPNSALWFDGIPGAGKSVLTSTIISDLQLLQDNSTALAYFYIEYSSNESQRFNVIVSSLLRQLIESYLETPCTSSPPELDQDLATLGPEQALAKLQSISLLFSTTILVIDGLDECDLPKDRHMLLHFLSLLGQASYGTIKVIATSRTIHDIQTSLCSYTNISIAATSTDVKIFVAGSLEERLRSDVEFYGIKIEDPELKVEIISKLVEKANGMFQWVSCQLDTISRLRGDTKKRHALQNLPEDLPETYRRIMAHVSEEERDLLRAAVLWLDLQATEDHLSLEELTDILAHQIKDHTITERDVLRNCGSLIKSANNLENVHCCSVLFSHFSVWEFITSRYEAHQWYYISAEAQKNFEDRESKEIVFHYMHSCKWDCTDKHNNCKILQGRHPFQKAIPRRNSFRFDILNFGDEYGHHLFLQLESCPLRRLFQANVSLEHQDDRSSSLLNLFCNILHSRIWSLSDWSYGLISDEPGGRPFFMKTDEVAITEVNGLELYIACLLKPFDVELIRWLVETKGCDKNRILLGGFTVIHAILFSLAWLETYWTEYYGDCVNRFRLLEVFEILLTPENIDYGSFVFLYGIVGGILDQTGCIPYANPKAVYMLLKQMFRLRMSTLSQDKAHEEIVFYLHRIFQTSTEQGCYMLMSIERLSNHNYIDSWTEYYEELGYKYIFFWDILISLKDILPNFLDYQYQWLGIIYGCAGFKEYLSGKLELVDKVSGLEPERDYTNLELVDKICKLCVAQPSENIEILRNWLRCGVGTLLTNSQILEFLGQLLQYKPLEYRHLFTRDQDENKVPHGFGVIVYFQTSLCILKTCLTSDETALGTRGESSLESSTETAFVHLPDISITAGYNERIHGYLLEYFRENLPSTVTESLDINEESPSSEWVSQNGMKVTTAMCREMVCFLEEMPPAGLTSAVSFDQIEPILQFIEDMHRPPNNCTCDCESPRFQKLNPSSLASDHDEEDSSNHDEEDGSDGEPGDDSCPEASERSMKVPKDTKFLHDTSSQNSVDSLAAGFPIHYAILRGAHLYWLPGEVKRLITDGYGINDCHGTFGTPLLCAIKIGSEGAVRILLGHGADVNLILCHKNSNAKIDTPLGTAISCGNPDILRLLLRYKADRFYVNNDGSTYFHNLVTKGDTSLLKIFLEEPTWWIYEILSRGGSRNISHEAGRDQTISPSSGANIRFCLDVFTKGLAAMQSANPSTGLGNVVNSLNLIAMSQLPEITGEQPGRYKKQSSGEVAEGRPDQQPNTGGVLESSQNETNIAMKQLES